MAKIIVCAIDMVEWPDSSGSGSVRPGCTSREKMSRQGHSLRNKGGGGVVGQ